MNFLLESTKYQNEQELLATVGCYHYHHLGLILLALNELHLHMHVNKTPLQIHFIQSVPGGMCQTLGECSLS